MIKNGALVDKTKNIRLWSCQKRMVRWAVSSDSFL